MIKLPFLQKPEEKCPYCEGNEHWGTHFCCFHDSGSCRWLTQFQPCASTWWWYVSSDQTPVGFFMLKRGDCTTRPIYIYTWICMRITISHYKDPFRPSSIMEEFQMWFDDILGERKEEKPIVSKLNTSEVTLPPLLTARCVKVRHFWGHSSSAAFGPKCLTLRSLFLRCLLA